LSYNMRGSSKGGRRRTGPLEPPNHAKQPSLPPSPTPAFLPLLPYLPPSLPPTHGLTFFVSSHASATKVEGHKKVMLRRRKIQPQELGPFFQLWPTYFKFDYYRKKQAILPPSLSPFSLSLSLSLYIYIYIYI
jgi:hypothetical protein